MIFVKRLLQKTYRSSLLLAKLSFLCWITALILFVLTTVLTNGTTDSNGMYSSEVNMAFNVEVTIGVVTFLLGCFFIFLSSIFRGRGRLLKRFLFGLLAVAILPLTLINLTFRSGQTGSNNRLRRIFSKTTSLLIILITTPLLLAGYAGIAFIINLFVGVIPFPQPVTGNSMNPTILDGESVNTYPYSSFISNIKKVSRGDIVIAHNDKTKNEKGEAVDYIKRVVGLPGDKIEIRDGYLFINDQRANEPYIASVRSTFGGSFALDCQPLVIPKDNVFILGDNRKRSTDSREVGFIPINDVSKILPFSKQKSFTKRWRDTSKDADQSGLASFDLETYYDKLNKIREDSGLKPLKRNEKLEDAAKIRANTIISFDERNISPDKSHLPPERAYQQAGYYNIVTGEISTSGYYDADELVNYWLEFNTKDSVLNKDYQETGIASVVGKINGCETQVIVQEFGGYIPPNYNKTDIDGWAKTLTQLREILPSWEKIKNYPETYSSNKVKADRLIEIINTRISYINRIVTKMRSNQWLSEDERSYTYRDKTLYNEQENIAKELNNFQWK